MTEKEFYNHLSYVSKRVQVEPHRWRLRWFLEREGFSASEIHAIELPLKFPKIKKK